MKHPGIEALLEWSDPGNPANCADAEKLFPGSHARMNAGANDMHPQHPMHPYNNGHSAMGCLPCAGLGAEPAPAPAPWYKNPFWILAGVGLAYYALTR